MKNEKYLSIKRKEEQRLFNMKKKDMEKRKRIIRAAEEPFLPQMCKNLYRCMIFFPVCSLIIVMIHALIEHEKISVLAGMREALNTFGVLWIIFSVLTIVFSLVLYFGIRYGFYQDRELYFINEIDRNQLEQFDTVFDSDTLQDPELQLYSKTVDSPTQYIKYIKKAIIGMVFSIILVII